MSKSFSALEHSIYDNDILRFPEAIYLHIPFCRSRCIYCDFYLEVEKQSVSSHRIQRFLEALEREITARLNTWYQAYQCLEKPPIKSIYFGGGTPSLLSAMQIQEVLAHLGQWVTWDETCEITLEVNPKDWTSTPQAYQHAGITRFSLGVQSFHDPLLQALSRRHRQKDIFQSIEAITQSNITSWSLDLMYGIPRQTEALWQKDIEHVLQIMPPHVSMYGLQVEAQTPLPKLIQTGSYPIANEDLQAQWYEYAHAHLAAKDLKAYELSNFAQAGHASIHNQVYWQQNPYIALGPSASGWIQGRYYKNTPSLQTYLEASWESLHAHEVPEEGWQPSTDTMLEQVLMFGLRQTQGVPIRKIAYWLYQHSHDDTLMPLLTPTPFQEVPQEAIHRAWERFWRWTGPRFHRHVQEGYLTQTHESLHLSTKGWLLSNPILSSLLDRPQGDPSQHDGR